jgi:hypothetical protein
MEIQRRRVPDWVHAPETSPPLEHARHVQSLNAIGCIPSVTEVCTIKQRILKNYLLTVKKQVSTKYQPPNRTRDIACFRWTRVARWKHAFYKKIKNVPKGHNGLLETSFPEEEY